MRYAVNLGDTENMYILDADTPFEAVRQAQIETGRLDTFAPGACSFTVTVNPSLARECVTWGDPCSGSCDCDTVITSGREVRVPVVLDRVGSRQVIVTPDRSGPMATSPVEVQHEVQVHQL